MNANQLAPQSLETEQALLNALFGDPAELPNVTAILQPDDFFYTKHQIIYQAVVDLGMNADIITIQDKLNGKLDDIGGVSYLMELHNTYATSFYAASYAQIIKDYATRRRLINAAQKTVQNAYNMDMPLEDVLNISEKAVFGVTSTEKAKRGGWLINHASNVLEAVLARSEGHIQSTGIPTGFRDLDELTCGWQEGDLIIVAGRPAMGKSSFVLNTAVAAARHGVKVAYFSLEMTNDNLTYRLMSMETGIPVERIQRGRLTADESSLFIHSAGATSELPIYMDDDPDWHVTNLRSKCRQLVGEGIELIVIDQLGNLDGTKNVKYGNENRVQEISFITGQLKKMAAELKVPVIAVSQLSRAVEQRADKRPMLSDLRDSGSIEQDADIVAFCYRDDYYNENSDRPNVAEVIIAKHRNGSTGTVLLHFSKALTKFSNLKHETLAILPPARKPNNKPIKPQ